MNTGGQRVCTLGHRVSLGGHFVSTGGHCVWPPWHCVTVGGHLVTTGGHFVWIGGHRVCTGGQVVRTAGQFVATAGHCVMAPGRIVGGGGGTGANQRQNDKSTEFFSWSAYGWPSGYLSSSHVRGRSGPTSQTASSMKCSGHRLVFQPNSPSEASTSMASQ